MAAGSKKIKITLFINVSNPINNKDILYYHLSKSPLCSTQALASRTHRPSFPCKYFRSSACLRANTHPVSDQAQARTCAEHGLWIQVECHKNQGSDHLLASGHSISDLGGKKKKRMVHLYFAPHNNLNDLCPLRTLS